MKDVEPADVHTDTLYTQRDESQPQTHSSFLLPYSTDLVFTKKGDMVLLVLLTLAWDAPRFRFVKPNFLGTIYEQKGETLIKLHI